MAELLAHVATTTTLLLVLLVAGAIVKRLQKAWRFVRLLGGRSRESADQGIRGT
ncbi:MAG: hypothetical protein ACREA9_27735 [Pyrinomonadaceae bacterium]